MPLCANLRVLIAEDNPINQRVAIAALTSLGHQGIVVSDGEKALRCLAQLTFDVVLMDVSMPTMDGLAALAEIRKRHAAGQQQPPVIMVTSHDLPGDRANFIAAGAHGYVAKPIHPDALDAEIRRVLRLPL